jgi:lipopolysaccharide/colanic/teichoic acid biosynthesis glycosyltransferase
MVTSPPKQNAVLPQAMGDAVPAGPWRSDAWGVNGSSASVMSIAPGQQIKDDILVSESNISTVAPPAVQPLTRSMPIVAPVEPLPRSSTSGEPIDTLLAIAHERGIAVRKPESGWQSVKRGVDVGVSVIALIVLAPVMACLALLIKFESRGPALFVQERVGQDGKIFRLLKFRSMRVDAESCSGPVFAKPNDPRCTRTGRFMRRYSLDELPQLINVLRGDMSLVGPRPERPYFVAQFSQSIPRYHERHRAKSGITGWAQVNGLRGDTSIDERTRYDLHYVEHWSPRLDVQIMLRTIVEIFQGHNAY